MTAAEHGFRFLSAQDALGFAFGMEAKRVRPSIPLEEVIRGTNPAEITLYDRIAEGMMIKSLIVRSLGVGPQHRIITAIYTFPVDRTLDSRKQSDIQTLRGYVYQKLPKIDGSRKCWLLVEDLIREKIADRPHHELKWWAKHTRKSLTTIYRWRRAVHELCELWEDKGMRIVRMELAQKGLLPP